MKKKQLQRNWVDRIREATGGSNTVADCIAIRNAEGYRLHSTRYVDYSDTLFLFWELA